MYEKKIPVKITNGTDLTFYVINGKWKRDILICIEKGIRRPIELQKHLEKLNASARVLNKQLSELVLHRVVVKKVHASVPPKVEYSLTEFGLRLLPILKMMDEWGMEYSCSNDFSNI